MTTRQCLRFALALAAVAALPALHGAESATGQAAVDNGLVRVQADLARGTYDILDAVTGAVLVQGAFAEVNGVATRAAGLAWEATVAEAQDRLGAGRRLTLTARGGAAPVLPRLEFRVYPQRTGVVIRAGGRNTGTAPVQLRRLLPLTGGTLLPGAGPWSDLRILNAPSGATQTRVSTGPYAHSPNSLLLTFTAAGRRHSVVLGGLRTEEFAKFAAFEPDGGSVAVRQRALAVALPGAALAAYLDCGDPDAMPAREGVRLTVTQGKPHTWQPLAGEEYLQSVAFHEQAVTVDAEGLDPAKAYVLGFSWWDFDANGRVESVSVTGTDGTVRPLLQRRALPAHAQRNQRAEEVAVRVPAEACRDGRLRVTFTNDAAVPNAVVGEVWLWTAAAAPALPDDWAKGRPAGAAEGGDLPARAGLEVSDPVGKRLDPGQEYLPEDSVYIDALTADPFAALETYGQAVRTVQAANPNPYDFPTVCAWYAGVWKTAGAQNHPERSKYRINTTAGLVEEVQAAAASGFLRYSRVAGRLVPDNYTDDNPQGWWDDEHWRRQGFYVAPYETSRTWGGAMRAAGGLAFTYFQPNRVSRDFRTAFPQLLVGGDAGRNLDYTRPEVQEHLRKVYGSMRNGIAGMMFDYCDEMWVGEASRGGFADPYVTATAFYRTFLRLAKEGLGPDSWIHERALGNPPADLAIGIADSQRTSGDTDLIDAAMVARSGLRWYKNRVVLHYDMDSKELGSAWKTPTYKGADEDGRRMLLTMAYVTSGRLLLATSFRDLAPQAVRDLARTFPYHREPRSARPVDAFVTPGWPQVYDFAVDPDWHQVTLFANAEPSRDVTITVPLAGEPAAGALGLAPGREYYVYDFWNDRFAGRLKGDAALAEHLRPGEARMLSVRAVADHPQVLSTNRHIMQGYVDLVKRPAWDAGRLELSGVAQVAGLDEYRIVLALNGFRPVRAAEGWRLDTQPGGDLVVLTTQRRESGPVTWSVSVAR